MRCLPAGGESDAVSMQALGTVGVSHRSRRERTTMRQPLPRAFAADTSALANARKNTFWGGV